LLLNCGAKSCPPIAYSLQDIEEQLNDAMYSFISIETIIDRNNKIITSSKILFWYIEISVYKGYPKNNQQSI
jgi:hypothetical protein